MPDDALTIKIPLWKNVVADTYEYKHAAPCSGSACSTNIWASGSKTGFLGLDAEVLTARIPFKFDEHVASGDPAAETDYAD